MDKRLILLFGLFCSAQCFGQSQTTIANPFDKKFRVGMDVNLFWSTLEGSKLADNYFTKPSAGLGVKGVYFFKPFLGASVGFGFQQMGTGIVTNIKNPVVGQAPDSTYRTRLRFNTWQIPISIYLRTPKKFIFETWRLGGSFSVIPTFNASTHQIYISLEPSLRVADVDKDVSSQYYTSDLMYQFAIGPEVSAGTGVLQFQFIYTAGTTNVYKIGQGDASNKAIGFRISYLF